MLAGVVSWCRMATSGGGTGAGAGTAMGTGAGAAAGTGRTGARHRRSRIAGLPGSRRPAAGRSRCRRRRRCRACRSSMLFTGGV
jgi:hypothetical protein